MENENDVTPDSSPVEAVNEPVETAQQEETVTPEVGQPEPQEELDDRGVPWKNRAMELERKLQEIPQVLPKLIEETLSKVQPKQQEPEYTIQQLEQFALDRPEMKAWAEEKKQDLLIKRLRQETRQEIQEVEKKRTNEAIRLQSEQYVVNHPKLKDCFYSDVSGRKQLDMSNPLSQAIVSKLNQVDPLTGRPVYERPDGLMIAAQLAYGDFMLNTESKTIKKTSSLQKELRQAQKKTLVEGGNSNAPAPASQYAKAVNQLAQTGSKADAKVAISAYLRQRGIIKE